MAFFHEELLNTPTCGPLPHKVIPIIGDGACLFRTLSYHIFGDQEVSYRSLRKEIVEHVSTNWNDFVNYSTDSRGQTYSDVFAYAQDMIRDDCYASLSEILAAGDLYSFNFEVYTNLHLVIVSGDKQKPIKRIKFDGNHMCGHFEAYEELPRPTISRQILRINNRQVLHHIVPMKYDANSLFEAIGYSMFGSKLLADETREILVEHVRNNFSRFKIMRHESIDMDLLKSSAKYSNFMLNRNSPGGYLELVAASEVYETYRFEVFKDNYLFLGFGSGQNKSIKRLNLLGDLSRGHFDVLTFNERSTISPSQSLVREESNPDVVLPPSPNSVIQETAKTLKRTVKRRARFTDKTRKNQMRKAAQKYAESNMPSIISRASEYQKDHPFNHLKAVRVYNIKHPEIHRRAVRKYTQTHPEVHREAVAKYTQSHPEVNREAVIKYNTLHKEDRVLFNKKLRVILKRSLPIQNNTYLGFSYDPDMCYEADETKHIGSMNQICKFCSALRWKGEAPGICCVNGKVKLPPFDALPDLLQRLLQGNHRQHENFYNHIRKYNSCFQLTSFGAGSNENLGRWLPTFKVTGQVYHQIGTLIPGENYSHRYLQVYFVGEDKRELSVRCSRYAEIDKNLVNSLQSMLHRINCYIRDFKTVFNRVNVNAQNDYKVVIHSDRVPVNSHRGRFNAPTTSEIALVSIGEQTSLRDIVVRFKNDQLKTIDELHRSYDPMQYPLMFCYGEDGYNLNLKQINPVTKEPLNKKLTPRSYYAYRIMIRDKDFNRLSYFRPLFSQYLVDMYAKIEADRLIYIALNQKKIRVDDYGQLRDALTSNDPNMHVRNLADVPIEQIINRRRDVKKAKDTGIQVILPSTFTGGPRYLHERTQDAMTYVRQYGTPDLFITFTCNPQWHEITEALHSGQHYFDRHDIVARVFNLKVKNLMNTLIKGRLFGEVRCYLYSIEWQKRGLPHVHLLIWLVNKLRSVQIDSFISAEIPDPNKDIKLYNLVKTHMIHGPCGKLNPKNICMNKNYCSKNYPKALTNDTYVANNGYPSYRRRSPANGGHIVRVKNCDLNNGWVVPYNPVLLRYYNCHINVEYCCDIKAIKYILKYINKGTDQATISLKRNLDEIDFYENGRYISSNEAAWRILRFNIHERYPTVMHLAVHLENGQRVYYTEENIANQIENPPTTTLLEFFKLCQKDKFALGLFYIEVPNYYTYDLKDKKFQRRKRGTPVKGWPGVFKSDALGRIYNVHPKAKECYYLRMLLHVIRGPKSFDDCKTVDGVIHATFQSACNALGMLDDGKHWVIALEEARTYITPYKMRELFSIMLVHCELPDPLSLWEKFKLDMADDLIRQVNRKEENIADLIMDDIYNLCLIHIEDLSLKIGGLILPKYNLPATIRSANSNLFNREYLREFSYDADALANLVVQERGLLTPHQNAIYKLILNNIPEKRGKIFFLDAPGGTGKTFLLNILINTIRSERKIAIATASSGIAATLLAGGRTAHSAFKLPLNLTKNKSPQCNIKKQSDYARVIKECQLIVWDEATMMHKAGFEALDRCLRDIRSNNSVMGGLTVLLAGDFRQTLPVIPRGTRADEVNACIKKSLLWPSVTKIALSENMRVKMGNNQNSAEEFANLLLEIGSGNFLNKDGLISIPQTMGTVVNSIDDLIAKIYPNIVDISQKSINWFCERAILCPTNARVNGINDILQSSFVGEEIVYNSVDSVKHEDQAVQYPVEFLNSQNPPGIPAHKLRLKVGSPIMLLRNIYPPILCNGTRLQIKALKKQLIEATILTGSAQGESVVIPRLPLEPSDFPIEFKRLQFPVKVCFAMTINKSQGQSLKIAGIDLRDDCFSHGQLYVGCSRVSSPKDLILLAPEGKTINVVYKEIL